ncbi:MAG: hypothetical protein OXN21_03860 [Chloroflexota bacterium]|nr:hypothetical protein [Chloroflexota bacterium]
MSEVMTWAEIEAGFDGQWVLIEDPETTGAQEIINGKVIFHSQERQEVYSKLFELRPHHPAILYVGEAMRDKAFAL